MPQRAVGRFFKKIYRHLALFHVHKAEDILEKPVKGKPVIGYQITFFSKVAFGV